MRQATSGQAGSVRFAVVVTLVVLLVWGALRDTLLATGLLPFRAHQHSWIP